MSCISPAWLLNLMSIFLGKLCWLVVPSKRRKMAYENIMQAFSIDKPAAKEIAKSSVTRFGKMFLEVLRIPNYNADNIGKYVKLEGVENLWEALSHGRGAVLATAHTGNWELLGTALAMHKFPLVAVAKKQHNASMDQFINEYRTLAGMHVTYKTSVLEMVRLLSEGKIIGLLMDQDALSAGVFVDFFDRKASTPQGSAALARMKNAPIVPAFITANADGTHTAIIHPPVWAPKTSNRHQDIFETTQLLTKIVENHIKQHPEEWFWLHNRWKTKPPKDEP